MEQEYYIKKWLSGTLTERERQDFEQTEVYKELLALDEAIKAFKAPEINLEDTYQNLELESQTQVVKINWWKPLLRVAAVVLVGVLLFQYYPVITTYFSSSTELVEAFKGETKFLELPDASQVTLNASSSISFKPHTWDRDRNLKLEGEAYFIVTKGASFSVNTDQGSVAVLGTEFNVKSRPQYFEVVCYEGSVLVESEQYTETLTAGHMFRIVNGTVIKDTDLKANAPSWIKNESTFISVPYGEVLREFERQYNVQVESRDIDLQQLFTGSFTHGDLNLALASITQPLNIGFKIRENQTISLTGEAK